MDVTFPVGVTIVMGKQGRLVVPAELRERLGLKPGDEFHVGVARRQIVLMRPEDAIAELRELGRGIPAGRSVVDDLLAERRAEAAAE